MIDDKFDPANALWFQNKWSIDLCQPAYKVSTLNNTQTATDPLTKTAIDGISI
jgi:hypothetical protein